MYTYVKYKKAWREPSNFDKYLLYCLEI